MEQKMSDTEIKKRIVLASASPRRKEILGSMGADFTVITADTDERSDVTDPAELTVLLARKKGRAVYELLRDRGEDGGAIIISADTVVACDGKVLGKPHDREDAMAMLSMLSGRTHVVATGVAVTVDGETYTDCSVTEVEVDRIPQEQIEKYIDSGDPFDKAGGYGIQGSFSRWIKGIRGCYFGVVGLPVNCLSELFYRSVGCYIDEI